MGLALWACGLVHLDLEKMVMDFELDLGQNHVSALTAVAFYRYIPHTPQLFPFWTKSEKTEKTLKYNL